VDTLEKMRRMARAMHGKRLCYKTPIAALGYRLKLRPLSPDEWCLVLNGGLVWQDEVGARPTFHEIQNSHSNHFTCFQVLSQ